MRHEAFGVKNILEFPVFFIVPSDPPSLFQFLFLRFLVSVSCFLSVVFVHFLVVLFGFVYILVVFVLDFLHFLICSKSRGWQIPQANAFGFVLIDLFDILDFWFPPATSLGRFCFLRSPLSIPFGPQLASFRKFWALFCSPLSLVCVERVRSFVSSRLLF